MPGPAGKAAPSDAHGVDVDFTESVVFSLTDAIVDMIEDEEVDKLVTWGKFSTDPAASSLVEFPS